MTSIASLVLEAADPAAAQQFYADAFGLDGVVRVRPEESPSGGFRGFTTSLLVAQPGNADMLLDAALAAGATSLKPAAKSLWGYGGVVQAPDGSIWKVATSKKKDTAPATRDIDSVALLLGVEDVRASKQFYLGRGFTAGRSFGGRYAELAMPDSPVTLALYGRSSLAKDAGVPADGSGSHRLVVAGDAGSFTDPDGFVWEAAD